MYEGVIYSKISVGQRNFLSLQGSRQVEKSTLLVGLNPDR